MSSALIIVDVQNDFCKGGSLEVPDSLDIIPVINKLRDEKFFDFVFLSSDWHPQEHASFAANHENAEPFTTKTMPSMKKMDLWPVHCVQNTAGSQFYPTMKIKETDIIIRKGVLVEVDSYSAFGSPPEITPLEENLKAFNVKKVFVCGLATDYCVAATLRDSQEKGFETYLIECASKKISQEKWDGIAEELKGKGVKFIKANEIEGCL